MHSNINNAPENNRSINVNTNNCKTQSNFLTNNHIFSGIRQNTCHNLVTLLAFLILILSTVILVMLMTLKYVGFGNLIKGDNEQKIMFKRDLCTENNFIERGNFLNIKIKTAFLFMCLQFILSFGLIILTYRWKKQTKKRLQSNSIFNFALTSSFYRALFLLISSCALLIIIVFGTYLQFFIAGNSPSISENCRFTIKNQQIVAIIVLSGVLIVLLMLLLILFACLQKKNLITNSPQCKEFSQKQKFPHASRLQSKPSRQWRNKTQKNQRSRLQIQQNQKRNVYDIFTPLKTQDFLLQSKFNQNQNFLISNQQEQREDNTDRKLILYKPQQTETNKKNLNIQLYRTENQKMYKQPNGNILIKEGFHENQKYSFEQMSVNNSLEKHKNSPMLNSVQKIPNQYELGILPFNSKKKSQKQQKLTNYQKEQKQYKSSTQREHTQQQGHTTYLKQVNYTKSDNNLFSKRQLVPKRISENIGSSGQVKTFQNSQSKPEDKNKNKNLTPKKVIDIVQGKNPSNEEAIKDQLKIQKTQQLKTNQNRKIKRISVKKHNQESHRQGQQETYRQQILQKQPYSSLVQAEQLDKTIIQRLQQVLIPISSIIQKQKIERRS